jgi:hypothetical protein
VEGGGRRWRPPPSTPASVRAVGYGFGSST